ncbi:MAG: 1-(5-phosphoribosyl)-5-[(5-phosphoribosylamino)methylideneamino]imidazole-4-carboxamide isomerase [Coriobacteriales bacterium]|nr:1-(5-phosphoribosyl)-5-[(5-phosphoribosylamino)methylideneamino]imidazole-4-carboxamide isomerase [Coriobacteriales bacterium]
MIVFPAIDILGGSAVRLKQGDYDRVTVYNEDPVAQARDWIEQGSEWIHVVDLDGARDGVPGNIEIVERIVSEVGAKVQIGGGIREISTLERLFAAGARRAVIGTKLITDPAFVSKATALWPDSIIAGVDARDGLVAIEGWREGTATKAEDVVSALLDLGVRHLVYTDISRDGVLTGVNVDAYRRIAEVAGFPVVASGGVSTLHDIERLAALGDDVVEGVIAGRALYEREFTLAEALVVAGGVC